MAQLTLRPRTVLITRIKGQEATVHQALKPLSTSRGSWVFMDIFQATILQKDIGISGIFFPSCSIWLEFTKQCLFSILIPTSRQGIVTVTLVTPGSCAGSLRLGEAGTSQAINHVLCAFSTVPGLPETSKPSPREEAPRPKDTQDTKSGAGRWTGLLRPHQKQMRLMSPLAWTSRDPQPHAQVSGLCALKGAERRSWGHLPRGLGLDRS